MINIFWIAISYFISYIFILTPFIQVFNIANAIHIYYRSFIRNFLAKSFLPFFSLYRFSLSLSFSNIKYWNRYLHEYQKYIRRKEDSIPVIWREDTLSNSLKCKRYRVASRPWPALSHSGFCRDYARGEPVGRWY